MTKLTTFHRIGLLLILFSPALLIGRELNNDLWFLLSSGRYVMENGFPVIEPFTLHQHFAFVMQQWLSSVLFWLVYHTFGQIGPLILTSLVFGLLIFIHFRLALLVAKNHFLLAYGVTLFSAIGIYPFMVTRPYIFSTLVLLLELYLLELYIARGKIIYLSYLPILSLLLINLHAALWPLFFILGIPYLVDALRFKIGPISGQGYSILPLLWAFFLALPIAVLNPYRLQAIRYLFRSYGHPEINRIVSEMKGLDLKSISGLIFFGFIAISLAVYWWNRQGAFRLRYVLLISGLLVMALSSARSFMLFAGLAQFPIAFYLFPRTCEASLPQQLIGQTKQPQARPKRVVHIAIALTLIILIVECMLLFLPHELPNARYTRLDTIIAALPESESVILYTGYNEGAYLEFCGYKPYIDARADVFLQENNGQKDVMQEYYDLQAGRLHYQEFMARYQFTHVLLGENDILRAYLARDNQYQLIKSVGEFQLYQKHS
ncbi:MAG: hypothetical protein PHC86_00425 [Eubacteriales bacterium]|nr:hypothetical protein [Eubacteriales bacterium]